jgi:hypothetical protein
VHGSFDALLAESFTSIHGVSSFGKAVARPACRADARPVLRWFLAGLVALVCWTSATARADHVVRVRAETRIELDVGREGATLRIRGALRDDGGGAVASRDVHVSVRPEHGAVLESHTVRTDDSGLFSVELPAAEGASVVDASFLGEPDLEASSVRVIADEQRAHVVLVVALPEGNRLSLDEPTHLVRISASSAHGGERLRVALRNEIGTELGSGTTDATGRLALEIASSELGPPAAGRLVARSEPDQARAGAQTEVPIVRYRETSLVWLDHAAELTGETTLRARLSTSTGPLERRAVGVFVAGEHVATRLTGPDGELAIRLDPTLAGSATMVSVGARFDADAPWLESSVAPERSLSVPRPTRVVPWLALGSGALFLIVAWWLRRRPTEDEPTTRQSRAPGVVGARPFQILASLRVVTGTIVHASTGEPIVGATVRCGTQETTSTDRGAFTLTPADGPSTLVVEAVGFETLQQRLVLPHRGEWRGAVVRLESRRDLASRMLLEILAITLPGEVASTATDRELVAIARTRGATSPELDALVGEVEQIVYAEAPPSASALERVSRLASAARSKLSRVDSASPASL